MKNKKLVSAVLCATAVSFSLTSFAACGGGREDYQESIDTGKTQLYISNYDGGFGSQWLEDLKEQFEEKNATVSFENGKVGCQIIIEPNKILGNGGFEISTTSSDLFFMERLPSSTMMKMINAKEIMNLNDVMDSILSQDGVSLKDEVKNAIKSIDGNYYVIPHYEGGGGVTYDRQLFEDKVLYIKEGGGYTNSELGGLSAGPDGVKGTDDDGLPATIKEFLSLCAWMKQRGVTPFIISGQYRTAYVQFILDRMSIAYDGYDAAKAVYTFDGEGIEYITGMTANENTTFGYDLTTSTFDVNDDNAYKLYQTKGRYYALSFLNEIIQKEYYSVKGWNSTTSHVDAQELYLKSASSQNPIAMIIEGIWWQNEASDVYKRMETENPANSRANRKFAWMPMPTRFDENDTNDKGDSMLTTDEMYSYAFARSGLGNGKVKLIKEFLKFCYTPENLEAYTVTTETTRPFTYSISEESYNGLSYLGKQIWNMHSNGKYVYTHSENKLFTANEGTLVSERWMSSISGNPLTAFFNEHISVYDYFNGMWKTEKTWKDSLVSVQ